MPVLSDRLSLIAALVPNGAKVCDIGTDHGYLAIELISSGKASLVIASDIREKPLSVARRNIQNSGVTGISLRLSDGLTAIEESEADTVVIAGMGGDVISGILAACSWIKAPDITLILQPMTSGEILRRFLAENGFEIKEEPTLKENGRLYSIIKAVFTGNISEKTEGYYFTGEINPKSPTGRLYIQKQLIRVSGCRDSLEGISGKEKEYTYYKNLSLELSALLEP